MNRAQLRQLCYEELGETSANAAFPPSKINRFLQQAWDKIWRFKNIKWNWLRDDTIITNAFTLTTTESTGTTVRVEDAQALEAGRKCFILTQSGGMAEPATIEAIDSVTSTLTFESPGLQGTYPEGSILVSNAIPFPDDFLSLLDVVAYRIDNGIKTTVKLAKKSEERIRSYTPDQNTTGTPAYYFLRGNNLVVSPLPDDAWRFHITYIAIPAALSDAAEPPMPRQYHDMICYLALPEIIGADSAAARKKDMIPHWQALANQKFQEMVFENNVKPDDIPPRMRYENEW